MLSRRMELRFCALLLISALVLVTIELEQQSSHRWEGILIAIAGVALIIAVGRLAKRMSTWMDRRFFREAYNAELILTDLGSSVAGIGDVKTLLQTVARRISVSLHVDRIAVLLDKGTRYEPAYALGFSDSAPPISLLARCRYRTHVETGALAFEDLLRRSAVLGAWRS